MRRFIMLAAVLVAVLAGAGSAEAGPYADWYGRWVRTDGAVVIPNEAAKQQCILELMDITTCRIGNVPVADWRQARTTLRHFGLLKKASSF